MSTDVAWSVRVLVSELARGTTLDLEPDAAARSRISRLLGLVDLPSLVAQVHTAAWFDGVQLDGRWRATVVQTCGISLDPFETELDGVFQVRCVPAGSPLIVEPDEEVEIDLDTPDPPDVLEDGSVDVAHYVVEHLALDIDPFPRKPGAAFEAPAPETPPSPFAVLSKLKRDSDAGQKE